MQKDLSNFTAALKAQIASELRIKFTDKLIAIPVDDKIRNDLHSIRKLVTSAGNIRLDAPREEGSHADRFWAAALAASAASAGQPSMHGPSEPNAWPKPVTKWSISQSESNADPLSSSCQKSTSSCQVTPDWFATAPNFMASSLSI